MKFRFTVVIGVALVFILMAILSATYFLTQEGCSAGSFACNDAQDVCVPQRDMCNGHADCPDGEDESFETCADFHGSQLILNAMSNPINVSLHACAQDGVPLGCICRNHHWIYCDDLNMKAIPKSIFGEVTRLILSNNSISSPLSKDLHYQGLTLLALEGNGIEILPDDLFSNVGRLEKLFLGYNRIITIGERLFRGLPHLNMIYLQSNQITYLHPFAFKDLTSLQYLDLSSNQLQLLNEHFPYVPALIDLILDGNLIRELHGKEFTETASLNYLGLSNNGLAEISGDSFHPLKNLTELDLSYNQLTNLKSDIFHQNVNLDKLYLSHNPMRALQKKWFFNLQQLSSLDLRGLTIDNIGTGLFDDLPNLRFLYFERYHYCSYAPKVRRCTPRSDGLSNFRDMLGRRILRILLWVIAIATCAGNVYVFFGRMWGKDENRSLSWIVRNLAVSDFLMGVYLGVIGAKDVEYRGAYHESSHAWMNSWLCVLSGATAMVSSEVSIMILTFMSIERFLLIAAPMRGMKSLSTQNAKRCMLIIWIVGMAIAITPAIAYRSSTKFYGSNAMCFPLHLDEPYFAGWQISAAIFIAINFLGFVIVSAMYVGMFISIWRTRHATTRAANGDFEFVIRFFFIVLTNGVCWVPIIVLKILALNRIFMPATMYAWIAIVVVPVNSAFNPLLYTLTTTKYRDGISKIFVIGRKDRNPTAQQDGSSSNPRQRARDSRTSLEEFYHSNQKSPIDPGAVAHSIL